MLTTDIAKAQCPTISFPTQSFCDLESPTIASLMVNNNGGGVLWYLTPTSTTPLSPATGLVHDQTYYADSSTSSCGFRPSVNVKVYSAPSGLSFQGDCYESPGQATVAMLDAIGNNIRWYLVPTGGTPLDPSTVLIDNTIYYASQTNPDTGCETSRLSVFVNNGIVPIPVGAPIQEFCLTPGITPTVGDLVASGNNNWYLTETSAVALDLNTPLVNGQSYFATTNDPPCESISRLEVIALLVEPADAGTNATLEICQNNINTTYDLFNQLGGSPEIAGAWSGPLPTSGGHLGTIDASTLTVAGSPYIFTYTLQSETCAPSTSTVSVTILPLPIVGITGNTTICSGSNATITFSGTPNATVIYTANGGAQQSISLNGAGLATINETYTQTTIYQVIEVISSETTACTAVQTGTITINVIDLPTVSLSQDQTVCSGEVAVITFTGTPNSTVQYTVNGFLSTITLDANGVATVSDIFTETTVFELQNNTSSGTVVCSQPVSGTMTVTVVPIAEVTISSDVQICPGENATITFTGTPNATVTYTINDGAPQTILLSSAGTATITNAYTETSIVTLISILAPDTTPCSFPATGSMVITVLPTPTVAISGNITICEGESATITFTGTPNSTVSYTMNGGATQTITLNSNGIATITSSFTESTVILLLDATSSSTPACTIAQSGSIIITVVDLPVIAISTSLSVCEGNIATVTFTGPASAVVTYTVNGGAEQQITLDASGVGAITDAFFTTTVYSIINATTSEGSNCSQQQTATTTITVIPTPLVSISSDVTICPNDAATITFTGTPNAIVQYTINGGAVLTIILDASGNASITQNYTATTIYQLVGITTADTTQCFDNATASVTVTVVPLPTVVISGDITICEGDGATVTFTGTPNSAITYTVNGETQTIVLDENGVGVFVGNFSVTTTFTLVSAASTEPPACSQAQSGEITITVIPAPTASVSAQSPVCVGESSTITFTATPNSIIVYTINGGANQTIAIGASGTSTITNTFDADSTITLVSVTLVGTYECSTVLSQSINVSIIQLSTVIITGTTFICSGEAATVTFTGTPNSTVIYTLNGVLSTIQLNENGTASVTNVYTEDAVFELIAISGNQAPNCGAPASGTAVITIVPAPTVTISGTTTVCVGNSATITFNGTPGAVIAYTANGVFATITLDANGVATFTANFNSNTTFVLQTASLPGASTCSQLQTGTAVITVLTQPTASISQNTAVCLGSSATVTFNGTPGATITYTVNGGSNQTIVLNSSGNAAIMQAYTATTIYSLVSVSLGQSGCVQPQSGTMIVNVVQPPVATITLLTNQTICSGQSATIQFDGTPNAIVSYTVNGGTVQTITLNNAGTATLSSVLTISATYALVSATTAGTLACSATQTGSVVVTITPVPNAGNDVSNQVFCANAGLQDLFLLLGDDADLGGIWSPTLSGGDGIFDPEVDQPGTYFYTVSGTAPCLNDVASVTVALQTPPNAGTSSTLALCSNQDPIDLFTLLGPDAEANGLWTPELASGTSIFDPAVDVAETYTYTINGTAPCGNASASITITITPGPEAGQDGELVLCINSASQNLFDYLNGTPVLGGTWSPALASDSGIFNPAIDAAGVYTYSFSGPGACDSDSATVNVTINPIPDAGENGTAFFCTNYAPADLFFNLQGTPQTGGVWSPALASGSGIFNPLLDAPGTYTYTLGGGLCEIDSATVEVTVTQSPNAGGNNASLLITTCLTTLSVDLSTALNGTQDAGTWHDDDATGALSNNIFNPSLVGPGTYHFTYTVGGGVSPCLFDHATVVVIVDPQPNAGTFATAASVCNSVQTFDLTTLLNNSQNGGTWTSANGQPITNPINIAALAGGTYSFTYTVINACGTDAEIVQLIVLPSPAFTNADIAVTSSVCLGGGAIVSFSNLTDGSYTINYSLIGSNTQTSQTVLLNITGGAGAILIPASSLPNAGPTQIVFTSILNNVTNCSAILSNVQLNFVVNPVSNLSGAVLQAANPCLGSPLLINISDASGLPNGVYNFVYTIPGASPSTSTTANVTITNGTGQIIIPATNFTSAGVYNGTLQEIISQNGCSNTAISAEFAFEILPLPNTSGAVLSAENICLGVGSTVTISGATLLPDGYYTVTYELSGATIATITENVEFVGGATSFVILANQLTTAGNITVTISQFTSLNGQCGAGSTAFTPITFVVANTDIPTLLPLGNEFCRLDSPTIASLSLNIESNQAVIWYDAPENGNAYAQDALLQNGFTYYASFVDSTCENGRRLAVTVSLNNCPELLIPDGFSPNEDGINDYFVIRNLPELYPNYKLEIYNRYGNILYKGDRNTQNWDGKSSQGGLKIGSNVVPTGVYFYILEFNDGDRKPIQGRLYLSR